MTVSEKIFEFVKKLNIEYVGVAPVFYYDELKTKLKSTREKYGISRFEEKDIEKDNTQKTGKMRVLENNEYYMSRISELSELSADLAPLEHNSFLLHGYFNYRHILIKKEGDKFLVGVPGNYYYREEMVAAMFGFPNFVPAKPEDRRFENEEYEKAVGEFGYYFA